MGRLLRRTILSLTFAATVIGVTTFLAGAESLRAKNNALMLDHGWQFRQIASTSQDAETGWLSATVPGDVHLDLLANKKIDEPFYRDNEAKVQWVENASWEYRDIVDLTPAFLARTNVDLVFDGIDSPAQVYLNGTQVLNTDDSFRIWRVPAKSYLHAGANLLRVVFPSPNKSADLVAAMDPWRVRTGTAAKTYIRKPAYEYGWDWAPRLVTSGIWRPVQLESWDKVRIADLAIHQRDITKPVANIDAEVEVEASSDGPAQIVVQYSAPSAVAPVTLSKLVALHAGRNVIDLPVEIRQPELWYPAGYGDQSLYEFTARISVAGQTADRRTARTGLRSIVLDRHPDQWGRSFQLIVNGIPVFAKGADVVPLDSFPNRVTTANYRRILESARDANMNMIRLWGGGYYETDEFYQICDELGIMVWQDFMFANDWQPGTYKFKLTIEAEARDQVRRLRNHPSVVVWCGNNEIEGGLQWFPHGWHFMALVPAGFGLTLGIFGFLASRANDLQRRIFVPINLTIGSVGALGGAAAAIRGYIRARLEGVAADRILLASRLTMTVLLLTYVVLCVRSFTIERRAQ